MGPVIRNSTATAQVVLVDNNGDRITTGVVSVTIKRPDSLSATLTSLPLPHIENGVYKVQLPKTAFPISATNYIAEWSIVAGDEEQNPTTFFDVMRY